MGDAEEEDEEDEDIRSLMNLEEKIKQMKVEWAKADGEDAAFIEMKIRDMEEFVADAKAQLGIAVDVEMKDAAMRRKRDRSDVLGDNTTVEGGNDGGGGIFSRFKKK